MLQGGGKPQFRTWFGAEVTLVEHLALYGAFHRSPLNRALHATGLPLILYAAFLAVLAVQSSGAPAALASLGTDLALTVGLAALVAYLVLDVVVAVATAVWVLGLWWLALLTASLLPSAQALVAAAGLSVVGWVSTVGLGHGRYEATIETDGRRVSSNVYFARGLFVLRDNGRKVGMWAAATQFAISPFHLTLSALFALSYRTDLNAQVGAETRRCLERLQRGQPPLARVALERAPI
jgi:uncharacterized membrane protein YGL010W